jgi:DNA polymerase-3 subunit delta'
LLFSGPAGVGKRTAALMIAKALNCENSGPDDFCDACTSCRKIDAGIHPDVYQVGLEEDSSEIKIAQIRDLLETLQLRPMEGARKVYILDPADAMNKAAENALLKALEEPPEDNYFILLAANPQSLAVTVRSRCQTYAFWPLTLDEMRRFGGEELALRWARGSIGSLKALDLAEVKARRDAALSFIEIAVRAKNEQFRDMISASSDLARAKDRFESNIDAIAILMEDVLYLAEGVPEKIVNVDMEPQLRKLAADLPAEQISKIAEFLRTIEFYMNTHVNRQMMTDVLAITSNTGFIKIAHDKPR